MKQYHFIAHIHTHTCKCTHMVRANPQNYHSEMKNKQKLGEIPRLGLYYKKCVLKRKTFMIESWNSVKKEKC